MTRSRGLWFASALLTLAVASPMVLSLGWAQAAPTSLATSAGDELDTLVEKMSEEDREMALWKDVPEGLRDLVVIEKRVDKIVKRAVESTVGIYVGGSAGSGVIIDDKGLILTAAHVSGAPGTKATLVLHDGREVQAVSLGCNTGIDSSMMRITEMNKGPFTFSPVAAGEFISMGQWCVAMGHHGGPQIGRTPVVRLGRVLSFDKTVVRADCTGVSGDSGGPLFNLDGEVMGIYSRIDQDITKNYFVPICTYHDTWERLLGSESWSDGGGGQQPGRQLSWPAATPSNTQSKLFGSATK